jgi:hypothetical protein
MKKYGQPKNVVTDGFCSYPGAMNEIGNADRHEVGRRLNNRAENSHQPFRQRERAMQRFRSAETLQKFSSVHAHVHNHFNQERHLVTREIYKQRLWCKRFEVEPSRRREVASGHAARTAFQILGAVLPLAPSLPSLN